MDIRTHILSCCGLHGFSSIPDNVEDFKLGAIKYCERAFGGRYGAMFGAYVIITTAGYQRNANKYLAELGFTRVQEEGHRNTNSGNTVYLWWMDRTTFNKKRNEWKKELKNVY